MALILDTGPLLALLDAGDPAHDSCVAMVRDRREDLVIPVCVLVEADYWIHKLLEGSVWQVLSEDIARGAYRLAEITVDDLTRAAELDATYPELGLGLVDASVVALTERLGETKVATLDRRHFSVVRPRHCEHLNLLPA